MYEYARVHVCPIATSLLYGTAAGDSYTTTGVGLRVTFIRCALSRTVEFAKSARREMHACTRVCARVLAANITVDCARARLCARFRTRHEGRRRGFSDYSGQPNTAVFDRKSRRRDVHVPASEHRSTIVHVSWCRRSGRIGRRVIMSLTTNTRAKAGCEKKKKTVTHALLHPNSPFM